MSALHGPHIAKMAQRNGNSCAHVFITVLEGSDKGFYTTCVAKLPQCFGSCFAYKFIIILEAGINPMTFLYL